MDSRSISSYREFWPLYVREHRRAGTRRAHFLGTTGAILALAAAAVALDPWLIPVAVAFGYGCAWAGHFFIEKNRPASFRHPLWSLRADVRMYGLMWAGRMDAEVERLTPRESL